MRGKNRMIKTIVVDDEKAAADELTYMLREYKDIQIINTFTDPKKALEAVLTHDTDVIFLDISMPEMDGFVLAEAVLKLKEAPFIVFVTAYDEYAINAFEINAVDYLLKPVHEDRLDRTVQRIREKLKDKAEIQSGVKTMIKERYVENKSTKLPLWKNDRIYLVRPKDVIYCTCSGGETFIYTHKDKFASTDSLNHFEEILMPYHFFRCHRNFLIQLDEIKEIVPWFNNTYAVKMNHNEASIPISRRKAKAFKEHLKL